ncbi:MAG: hypothetical protein FJW26_20010 [Acidimicrobiia bacterium]|nr:hypothetical protein [Acidimicrobiia bacterium]
MAYRQHFVQQEPVVLPIASMDCGNPFQPAKRASIMRNFTAQGWWGSRSANTAIGKPLFEIFASDVVALLQPALDWDGYSWND